MRKWRHPNIVRFYGIVIDKPPFMIILEYVNGGDLRNFMQKHADVLQTRDQGKYCTDAAQGYFNRKQILL